MGTNRERQSVVASRNSDLVRNTRDSSPSRLIFCLNSDDEDDEYNNAYRSFNETQHVPQPNDFEFDDTYGSEPTSSTYEEEDDDVDDTMEPVDIENNGLLWLPPEPEDEEDEKEDLSPDDDDVDDGDDMGELVCFRNSNGFGTGGHHERSSDEKKEAIKNVVDGHFSALVSQLLRVENLPFGEYEDEEERWLEIVTSLSWEAATLLKPDMSGGGGMDPGGYVKVKCIASGKPCDSTVIKGVVCKKNVAHRRMTSKLVKPRIMILGGAIEYQRVSSLLSSVNTLLQQEMDHLKKVVARIATHQPDVLLVEKSVSRFAQDYLLEKDISLVRNIKRPLLERIARCTGAEIVPSIDKLSSPRLGLCEKFHVERFLEEHGSAGQGRKKLVKTLMYFEGCPKPLGCTILLRGTHGDELKKVKHVVQYGIFAAYHMALETSFLADEGASLPERPLTVGLPDKSSITDRSISTVPPPVQPEAGPAQSVPAPSPFLASSIDSSFLDKLEKTTLPCFPNGSTFNFAQPGLGLIEAEPGCIPVQDAQHNELHPGSVEERYGVVSRESLIAEASVLNNSEAGLNGIENGAVACNARNPDNPTSSSRQADDSVPLKEEIAPAPSDNQSILVSLSSRCVWKGTVCERSHLFRVKYYGNFDKPLGRFLRDNLFDQNCRCRSCEMPSEAHVHCYTHRQGTIAISVKKLPEFLLPGEKEGKIWMWHRCLRCPRLNGFPPATRRIVMSEAAWGLSFGKFLELSFSNHAAATRVACCGHSLHRDCLRFYGFGTMVACFRYSSIDVLSVYLPPFKLLFGSPNQEWMQKEINEVVRRAELLFSEILCSLNQIRSVTGPNQVAELEGMLQREKLEFEESLQKNLNKEAKKGLPAVDILDINRLRRQLLFQSYMWDQRLVYAADSDKNKSPNHRRQDKPRPNEMVMDMNVLTKSAKSLSLADSVLVDEMLTKDFPAGTTDHEASPEKEEAGVGEQCEFNESGANVRRALSEGQFPILADLSDTLDAAWIGETTVTVPEEGLPSDTERHRPDQRTGTVNSLPPALPSKGQDNMEEPTSWLGMPFLNFYRAFNKNFLASTQKLDTLSEYKPVYVSSFRRTEFDSGGRLLLPVGVNDTVVPVFDDEPTSIIAYALISPDYHSQLSKSGKIFPDTSSFISTQSFDESIADSLRSFGLVDDGILSLTSSRSSLVSDPISQTKSAHVRTCFSDDGPFGSVRCSVTCYYAKRFEALRKICCPSELDFIRSLSRCKKWGAQGGKSNVFFAKTLDDRFIVKQVTKTELESFIKFASGYFKYLSESISSRSPTCLSKILGVYQVTSKHLKGGRESRIDVLVMENLLFGRNLSRTYDLKGSSRSRYNPDPNGSNKVLLDQNLIEAMPTSPIFVGNKAKRLLERAVWNDTSFLASIDVMDYSLLVGVDEENHELVLGIIDFMRQYTWDKHLETWVKASGILGGPKNASPTVISPMQYKKRFRKAMTTYFLMLPDQWSQPPTVVPSKDEGSHSQPGPPAVE